jgi:hypothetical protein
LPRNDPGAKPPATVTADAVVAEVAAVGAIGVPPPDAVGVAAPLPVDEPAAAEPVDAPAPEVPDVVDPDIDDPDIDDPDSDDPGVVPPSDSALGEAVPAAALGEPEPNPQPPSSATSTPATARRRGR